MNYLKKIVVFVTVILFLRENGIAQTNLVKNPSFEDTISCPMPSCDVETHVWFWKSASTCTPDYFNACAPVGFGCNAPDAIGFQLPSSGQAYCGLYVYDVSGMVREYIQGQLSNPLVAGKKYTVSFYTSLSNISKYSTNTLGAYLSVAADTGNSCLVNLLFSPQIINNPERQLDDTLNWMQISGDYEAVGGEKYITIGNFSDDAHTNTVLFNSSPWGTADIAYYYIDEVSVIEKFNIPTFIEGNNILEIKSIPEGCTLILYNLLGQIVYKNTNYNNNFNTIDVSSGIYVYVLEEPNHATFKGKLCIVH